MFHIEGANSMYVMAVGQYLLRENLVKGKKWYSLTADYAFGHDLLRVAKKFMPADYLSGGEQQMVAVARALAGDVRVLLLDEPFEGLSPAVTEELFEAFDRLRHEIAIIIVDHHLELALALSDRTVVLERGSVTWTGASALLKQDLDLRRKVLWL